MDNLRNMFSKKPLPKPEQSEVIIETPPVSVLVEKTEEAPKPANSAKTKSPVKSKPAPTVEKKEVAVKSVSDLIVKPADTPPAPPAPVELPPAPVVLPEVVSPLNSLTSLSSTDEKEKDEKICANLQPAFANYIRDFQYHIAVRTADPYFSFKDALQSIIAFHKERHPDVKPRPETVRKKKK